MTKLDDATAALRSGSRYRIVGRDHQYDHSEPEAKRVPTAWAGLIFTYRTVEDRPFYDHQPNEIGALWLTDQSEDPAYIIRQSGYIVGWEGIGTGCHTLALEAVVRDAARSPD